MFKKKSSNLGQNLSYIPKNGRTPADMERRGRFWTKLYNFGQSVEGIIVITAGIIFFILGINFLIGLF